MTWAIAFGNFGGWQKSNGRSFPYLIDWSLLTQILSQAKIEILSTGGTAKMLREAGVPAKDISEHTGFPEMMDGRVKTLHPKVHGGLLFIRGNEKHESAAREHGIAPIDLVVVNLYPFEQTVARPNQFA